MSMNIFSHPQLKDTHMKFIRSLILFVAASVLLHAQEAEKPVAARVLIAMEQTEFKKRLVNAMKPLLERRGMQVTIVEDSKHELNNFKASEFDLVFITNSGVWSKVRPWVTEWIDNNRADTAKILLHTTKKLKWQEHVYVDAVSSASSNAMAQRLAEDYVAKLVDKR
jgi:hypothetical protein